VIVDLLVTVFLGVFNALVGLLPEYDPDLTPLWHNLGVGFFHVNKFFPLTDLFICLGLIIGFSLFLGVWHLVEWLWAKVPFKST
jgi:hypothetical protein